MPISSYESRSELRAKSTREDCVPSEPPPRAVRVATMPKSPSARRNRCGSLRLRRMPSLGPFAGTGVEVLAKKMP